jgi:hypothetical protein
MFVPLFFHEAKNCLLWQIPIRLLHLHFSSLLASENDQVEIKGQRKK